MQVALAWGAPPAEFLAMDDEMLDTAIAILEDRAKEMERKR